MLKGKKEVIKQYADDAEESLNRNINNAIEMRMNRENKEKIANRRQIVGGRSVLTSCHSLENSKEKVQKPLNLLGFWTSSRRQDSNFYASRRNPFKIKAF